MPNHAACEVLGVDGEWTQIQSGEVTGYVKTEYQKGVVPEQFSKVLYNGNRIEPEMIRSFEASMQQKPIRIYDEKDHFIGIYEFQQERGNFKPVKVFMEE
jgi:tRNA pseudouridine55 synthase